MKIRIAAGASREEASAIAAAIAEHVGEDVRVRVGDRRSHAWSAGPTRRSGPSARPSCAEQYREGIDVHRMASEVVIDEIVPPSDLRTELAARFAFYEDVEKELPSKKHGTVL